MLKATRQRRLDVILVWKLDRLGRNLRHLVNTIHELMERKIGFRVLTGQGANIDTTTASGKLVFGIFAALAEFERQLIQERTQAGLRASRARGRMGGRPKALATSKRQRAVHLYQEKQLTVKEICGMMGISKPTLYAYVRQAQASA